MRRKKQLQIVCVPYFGVAFFLSILSIPLMRSTARDARLAVFRAWERISHICESTNGMDKVLKLVQYGLRIPQLRLLDSGDVKQAATRSHISTHVSALRSVARALAPARTHAAIYRNTAHGRFLSLARSFALAVPSITCTGSVLSLLATAIARRLCSFFAC